MKQQMTIEEIQACIKAFCDERDWEQYHMPKDLAIGISTEANELLDLFRFQNEPQALALLETKSDRIGEELVDVLYFVLRFAQLYEIDLTASFQKKMLQNAAKYPVSQARGNNQKYTAYNGSPKR